VSAAVVTLKLSPVEFDITREALKSYRTELGEIAKDTNVHPAHRQEARGKVVLISQLLENVNRP